MPLRDQFGLDVSTDSIECVQLIDEFSTQFISYGNGAGVILKAVEADEGCALAHTLKAFLFKFVELDTARETVSGHLKTAKQLIDAHGATAREKRWHEAIHEWHSGNYPGARAALVEITQMHPSDILAAKLCQILMFLVGDVDGQLRLTARVQAAQPDAPYVNGMLAYALAETGQLEQAEEAGRKGNSIVPDPWSQHAVAHAMDRMGRFDEGIEYMEANSPSWDGCNSFMYCHNWWHTALFHLDKGNDSVVLDLYDERVWGVCKEYSEDQVGAATLLWRCELRGVPVAERWLDVADHISPKVKEHVSPFIDMQYAYALARAGRDEKVEELCESLSEQLEDGSTGYLLPETQGAIVKRAIDGLVLHARGQYERSATVLNEICESMKKLGGSDAQQDVFRQTYIDGLIRTGQNEKGLALLWDPRARTVPFIQRQVRDLGGPPERV